MRHLLAHAAALGPKRPLSVMSGVIRSVRRTSLSPRFWKLLSPSSDFRLRFMRPFRPAVLPFCFCAGRWQILADSGKFWQNLPNFARLVLGCIDVSDSESRRIFQLFINLQDLHSFAPLLTQNFNNICQFLQNFGEFSRIL